MNKYIKKLKNNKGITLMELLLAIPIFAVVALAIGYVFSSMTQVSTLNRGYLECQIAANNLLTYMEGTANVAKLNGTNIDTINGCSKSNNEYTIIDNLSPTKDGSFKVNIKRTTENELPITAITVTKKDTDNSFMIKTYFPEAYFKE